MGRIRTLIQAVIILTLVTAVSWQAMGWFHDPTREAFLDADRRLRGEGPGERESDVHGITFVVPRGVHTLRVGSIIDVDGWIHFTLTDPHGRVYEERLDGDTLSKHCCWQRIGHPAAGTWEMNVRIGGNGAYVLGFYFEDE